jgi:ssDNA thymidine ADP-ribosyltransferase, DarT
MSPTFLPDGGFTSESPSGPRRDEPLDWYVWHFTHVDNLASIVEDGVLRSDNSATTVTNVGNLGIKGNRRLTGVQPDSAYPPGKSVADHVPWYIAAKSPMLYAVSKGHDDYRGGSDPIVFFGVLLRDLEESGLTWCASDRNAGASIVRFSRDVDSLGDFVDFDLLGARMWNNIPDDPDRAARRAAEVLVLDEVPLSLTRAVVAKTEATLLVVKSAMDSVPGQRIYQVVRQFFY